MKIAPTKGQIYTTLALIALSLNSSAVLAQEYPHQVFDATFKSSGPAGIAAMHTLSDGKGHLRQETAAQGMKIVSIIDYPGKVTYTIMDAQKSVFKMPLGDQTVGVHDEASAKKANAKSLGTKVISGHPCHGWEYKTPEGTTVVWTGDDIHYLVKSEATTAAGKMTMELTSWSTKEPAGDAFKVPDGYRVSSLPGTR